MKQSPVLAGKRFHQVICRQETAKNRICGQVLGYVELSRPNTTPQYCRRCKRMEAWDVDSDGAVTVTLIPQAERIKIYDEAIILRERTDG